MTGRKKKNDLKDLIILMIETFSINAMKMNSNP